MTKGWIVAGAASMVLVCGLQSRAEAVPTSPPSDWPYTTRVATPASNGGPITDPVLNNLGLYRAVASTDASGSAVKLFALGGSGFNRKFFDYYFQIPYQTSSGAPDPTYQVFDLRDNSGHFAGYTQNFTWVENDVRWYFIDYAVNGEYHYIYFSVDANNVPNESSIVQVKGAKAPDRCKVIADWGASMCPRDFEPIKEIPTEIQSVIIRSGWFGDTMNWVSDKARRATNAVGQWLSDPTVQYVLVGAAVITGVLACCIPASATLVGCALCAVSGLATVGAATGNYHNSDPLVITNSSQLRSFGILGCTSASCSYQCVSWGTPQPNHVTCVYRTTNPSACPAGWTFVPSLSWCSYTPF